jgi:hypothetical protein
VTLTSTIREQATRLAHEAVLAQGGDDPDDDRHGPAAAHRQQLCEALLEAIEDYWQEQWAHA